MREKEAAEQEKSASPKTTAAVEEPAVVKSVEDSQKVAEEPVEIKAVPIDEAPPADDVKKSEEPIVETKEEVIAVPETLQEEKSSAAVEQSSEKKEPTLAIVEEPIVEPVKQ